MANNRKETDMNTCETCKANKVCNHDRFGFENCKNYLPEDIDVVMCKDCKYVKTKCYYGMVCSHWAGMGGSFVTETDYCSCGERKEDNT